MEQDNRANVARLKDEVIQEYGVNPEREELPHDVRRWVEVIHEHLTSEELTVSWLMEQPGLSKKTGELLRVKSGYTTKAYINTLRVEIAKRLLITDKVNFTKIAIQLGYRDRSSFTKAFVNSSGISPSEKRGGKNSRNFSRQNSHMDI